MLFYAIKKNNSNLKFSGYCRNKKVSNGTLLHVNHFTKGKFVVYETYSKAKEDIESFKLDNVSIVAVYVKEFGEVI